MGSRSKPVAFQIYFNAHADAPNVWTVKAGRQERHVALVVFFGKHPWTRYRGPRARQPKAVLCGVGWVAFRHGAAVMQPKAVLCGVGWVAFRHGAAVIR